MLAFAPWAQSQEQTNPTPKAGAKTAGKDMGKTAGAGAEKGRESNGVLHRREWKEDCPLLWILTIALKCKDAPGTSRILRTAASEVILGSMILASVY